MIDRSFNYGRHLVHSFLESCRPYRQVLDLGAGHGTDLQIARSVEPQASCSGIEVYEAYALELRQQGFRVMDTDIESEPLPLEDGSVDVIIANQILEHTKNVFWI